MSFETLKVSELKKIAEDFAVDIDGVSGKKDIIAALSEEGVTWAIYKNTQAIEEEEKEMNSTVTKTESKTVKQEDMVLVKMTRDNFRYDIMGHTFTKEHPFIAMDKDTAQAIFDKEEGFRLATPTEVREFYN
jgi:UDP-glucose 6-dehydrogenase